MRCTVITITSIVALFLVSCGSTPAADQAESSPVEPSPTLSATAEAMIDTPLLEDPTSVPASLDAQSDESEPVVETELSEETTSVEAPAESVRMEPQDTVPVTPLAATEPESQSSAPVQLIIDDIGMNRSLLSVGLDANNYPVVPNHDVGWYNLGAKPGDGENVVLWGHVLRFRSAPDVPAPFARMKDLPEGARVTLVDEAGQEHAYAISQHVWADPSEIEYILPQGREMVTMVSCIGDKVVTQRGIEMTNRLITIAEPVD